MANHPSIQLLAAERLFYSTGRIPIGDGSGLLTPSQSWERVESEVCLEFSLGFPERTRIYLIIPEPEVSWSQAMPRRIDALLSCSSAVTYLGQLGFPAVLPRASTNADSSIPLAPKDFLEMGAH